MHEFEIIEQFFTRPIKNKARFPLEIGDDCALISPPEGYTIATSIDTIAVNVHFPDNSEAYDIGYKSLAVSLSDLAAMGADPSAVLLALTIPESNEKWLAGFRDGFFSLADQYQVELIGGNITRGHLSISTVTYGWVPNGQALRRSGAQIGDDIYVTGTLGNAGLALQKISQQERLSPELHQHFFRPQPRLMAGLALRGVATAAIDISDGLAADLGKLLQASNAGAHLFAPKLPLSNDLQEQCSCAHAINLALTAGEDYELCFTAPQSARSLLSSLFIQIDCGITCIGQVEKDPGLRVFNNEGHLINISNPGYQHFHSNS